jgi:PKD repeat protein
MKAAHRFAKPGTYNVTLEVADATGLSSGRASDVAVVKVNYPPVAATAKDLVNAAPGDTVKLDASPSRDPDGGVITDYLWSFPDGAQKRQQVVAHVFNKPETYDVVLRVTDDEGVANSTAETIQKVKINHAPVAKLIAEDTTVALNTTQSVARFDGSKSYDPDGRIVAYEWDFGDGKKAFDIKPEHAYEKPGKYAVKLTVVDDSGARNNKGSATVIITANAAPEAKIKVTQ